MPFTLGRAFTPSYTLLMPKETNATLLLELAEWDSGALVHITNEAGRRFKVGFVQVLFDNEIVATYRNHTCRVVCNSLPVADGTHNELPFYEIDVNASPEVAGTAGTVVAEAKIYDSPQDPFDWYHGPGTGDPLIHVQYRLKFKTWLVVRDITTPHPPNFDSFASFAKVLAQFNYVLEAGFNVDVAKPLGSRCGFASGSKKPNKAELVWPPTPVHACVWTNAVANDVLNDTWTPRTVIRPTNAPLGPVNTGVNVKGIAALFNKG